MDSATTAFRDIIADPLIYPRATYELSDERRELPLTTARAVILSMKRAQSAQHWKGLRLQGKLACLSFADQSLSHTIYSNVSIGEDILIFTIRARLQVLPTKSNLSTWYPSSHEPHCILHSTTHDNETIAHVLNGCNFYKGLYIARHDRLVYLISHSVKEVQLQTTKIYKHSAVKMDWFNCAQNKKYHFQ